MTRNHDFCNRCRPADESVIEATRHTVHGCEICRKAECIGCSGTGFLDMCTVCGRSLCQDCYDVGEVCCADCARPTRYYTEPTPITPEALPPTQPVAGSQAPIATPRATPPPAAPSPQAEPEASDDENSHGKCDYCGAMALLKECGYCDTPVCAECQDCEGLDGVFCVECAGNMRDDFRDENGLCLECGENEAPETGPAFCAGCLSKMDDE